MSANKSLARFQSANALQDDIVVGNGFYCPVRARHSGMVSARSLRRHSQPSPPPAQRWEGVMGVGVLCKAIVL